MSLKNLFNLEGKTALITGGSRGLGLQIAEALGEMGCHLILTARKAAELEQAKQHLENSGYSVSIFPNNLAELSNIPAFVDSVQAQHAYLDILVNNAGATWGAPAEDYPEHAWQKVMDLNVNALFFLTQEIGRRFMIPRRQGKIINIASIAGLRGPKAGVTTIAYNTSKAAAINFTRALAAEWGKYNININAICPGFFPSKLANGLIEQLGDNLIKQIPLGRIGGEEDLKGLVALLASEAGRHITGQAIAVDGGSSIC